MADNSTSDATGDTLDDPDAVIIDLDTTVEYEEAPDSAQAGWYNSELRVSLVLYGGSSLVVYMNGVAQELLNMVKATSTPVLEGEPTERARLFEAYDLAARITQRDIDTGYADLLWADPKDEKSLDAAAIITELKKRPTRRRLTIDVLSGASAGGLNAIFLSRALLMNGDVEEAAKLLVEYGDVVGILNDGKPAGEKERDPRHWAKSLLDGDRLYELMLGALYRQEQSGTGQALVEAIDCYMALTDLRGVPTGTAVDVHPENLEHRAVAHLQYGTLESYGATRNDFMGRVNGDDDQPRLEPFLTFVGRATSAHPAAFHPTRLSLVAKIAKAFELRQACLAAEADAKEAGKKFIEEDVEVVGPFHESHPLWAKIIDPVHPAAPLPDRWFSDGGNLDNKPFTNAIEPVKDRRASIPVDRKVVWVEPDPSPTNRDWTKKVAPTFWNVTLGAYGLPRKEGIAGDLKDIQERNRTASLLKESIEDAIAPHTWPKVERDVEKEKEKKKWHLDVPETVERELYEVERARYVVDHLTEWSQRVYHDAGGAVATREDIHEAVMIHVHREFEEEDQKKLSFDLRAGRQWPHRRLLVEHDLPYRLRRLNYIDQLLSRRQRLINDPSKRPSDWTKLHEWRTLFTAEYLRLAAVDRELKQQNLNETDTRAKDFQPPVIASVEDPSDPEEERPIEPLVAELLELRQEALAGPMAETRAKAIALIDQIDEDTKVPGLPQEASPEEPLRDLGEELRKAWLDFDLVDMHLLPRFSDLRGELDSIETVRFSPSDTKFMGGDPEQRLGGVGVAHFGAFFDRRWRLNDIFWGRLDAAECIVKMLIPAKGLVGDELDAIEGLQLQLVQQIQHRVIEESGDAVKAIADLAPEKGIAPGADEKHLRKDLRNLKLDLSLAGDAKRSEGWKQILGSVPDVLGRVIALGRFDPWMKQRVDEDAPTDDEARGHLVEDARSHARSIGTLVDGTTQLISPTKTTPLLIRWAVLPLLAAAGLIGIWSAYDSHRSDLWLIGGAIAAGAALVWLAGHQRPKSASWRRRAPILRIAGALLILAGVLVPLLGEQVGVLGHDPSDQHEAFGYTLVFVSVGVGLAVVGLLGVIASATAKKWVMSVLLLVGLFALIAAARAHYQTAIQLFGSLMIVALSGGLFALLRTLQSKLSEFATKDGHD